MKRRDLISDDMLDQNIGLHKLGGYGQSGHKYITNVLGMLMGLRAGGTQPSLLDYGCGQHRLRDGLREVGWEGEIREYDPALKGFDAMPLQADLVVCTDVLEHVEPSRLDAVLGHIRELTLRVAYLDIATRRANKNLPNGMNAHLILETPKWWAKRIRPLWTDIYWIGVDKNDKPHEVKIWARP